VNLQFELANSLRNGEIILEMELDIECFRTECSEVKVQFEVTSRINFGNLFSIWNWILSVIEQNVVK